MDAVEGLLFIKPSYPRLLCWHTVTAFLISAIKRAIALTKSIRFRMSFPPFPPQTGENK
jgi:hypothetical protein